MKLLENPRFKAFIVDVAVNTCDLSRREYLPNYEVSHLDKSLEELLEKNLPRAVGLSDTQYKDANYKYRKNRETILKAKHDPFELEMFKKVSGSSILTKPAPLANEIVLPVLDRFLTLLATLKRPSLTSESPALRSRFLEELTLAYGPSVPLSLVDNQDFMLKFQLVSLAKNHNFFGGMDTYMKEFSRMVLDMGDS